MGDFYHILDRLERCRKRAILATIIDVKGTSYRKRGTSMLIVSGEDKVGMISGGCLEKDLEARSKEWFSLDPESFEQLKSRVFVYDMMSDNELVWGRASGCNGVVTVLVEPVTTSLKSRLIQVKTQMDRGLIAVSLRVIKDGYCVRRAVAFDDGRVLCNDEAFKSFIERTPLSVLTEESGTLQYNESEVVRINHRVRPRLHIFGAGDDAIPLTELAAKTGWRVTVSDFRAALCNKKRFPEVESCRVGAPADLLLNVTDSGAIILMTHDFQVDQILLHGLLDKDCDYLGVLGPKERTQRLLKGTPWPEHLHTPVGIPIKAEGPDEIAVSIMAELIKVYHYSLEKVLAHG